MSFESLDPVEVAESIAILHRVHDERCNNNHAWPLDCPDYVEWHDLITKLKVLEMGSR